MTLRQRLVLTVGVLSLLSALIFSVSLYFLVQSTLNLSESSAVERGIEIAVAAARDPAERAEALSAFRAHRQLQVVRGLVAQRVPIAGLLYGAVIFALSLGVSSLVLLRLTRPLNRLTAALNRAGSGDLAVKIEHPSHDEIGNAARAFNDMTDRLRRLQEDLRRSERLAAWRDVARILGHEVRNPLTPIRLSVERIQQKFIARSADLPEVIDRSTRTILEEIDALDRIVREFSDFARLPAPRIVDAELNRLIADTVAQYRLTAPDVVFETALEPSTARWPVDPELMRRVFGNIIKNSIEAVAQSAGGDAGLVRVSTTSLGTICRIVFEDNGPGIDPDSRARAFEPYYTTKAKGTGLGLALVRNIVTGHSGSVRFDSPDRGTRLTIQLPKGADDEAQTAGD